MISWQINLHVIHTFCNIVHSGSADRSWAGFCMSWQRTSYVSHAFIYSLWMDIVQCLALDYVFYLFIYFVHVYRYSALYYQSQTLVHCNQKKKKSTIQLTNSA